MHLNRINTLCRRNNNTSRDLLRIKCVREPTHVYRKGIMPWKYFCIVSGWTAVCSYVCPPIQVSEFDWQIVKGRWRSSWIDARILLFNLKRLRFIGRSFEIVYFLVHQLCWKRDWFIAYVKTIHHWQYILHKVVCRQKLLSQALLEDSGCGCWTDALSDITRDHVCIDFLNEQTASA